MAVHRIKKGLDIPITGAPEQVVDQGAAPTRVAVVASDFVGMKPRLRVDVGDQVKRGQPLFDDRKREGVVHTAPAAGVVVAVNRGKRRAFQSIVIELTEAERAGRPGDDELQDFASYTGAPVSEVSAEQVRDLLLESGAWTAFRTRPYGRVPNAGDTPKSIFVTASDTNPLSARPDVVLEDRQEDFQRGLDAIAKLADVHLCQHESAAVAGDNVSQHTFAGPHPAGNVGTHIHLLDPVWREKTVWHLGYQDVAAIGELIATGVVAVSRVVALGGPQVDKPRLLSTRLGASVDELVAGELKDGENRVISGSILSGTIAMGEIFGYLGRYANQVSVLREGRSRNFLGWLTPGLNVFSTMPTFLSGALPSSRLYDITTAENGGKRAMVPIGRYEEVFPLDILPTFLLRSILSGDLERAEALGVLELAEEDLALCTVVCPNKHDFGPVLRTVLNTIEAEG
ncbi:MAG TPA: Na(+)-translocating NADH-quinone reductase subunit A [Myxococcota bacterium]|nr:Na(+)-translocating NADH-quinone reductase subunit A [Myxococcota bacterium]